MVHIFAAFSNFFPNKCTKIHWLRIRIKCYIPMKQNVAISFNLRECTTLPHCGHRRSEHTRFRELFEKILIDVFTLCLRLRDVIFQRATFLNCGLRIWKYILLEILALNISIIELYMKFHVYCIKLTSYCHNHTIWNSNNRDYYGNLSIDSWLKLEYFWL